MQQKGTHIRATSEFKPSPWAITVFVVLLVIAVGAFGYYCYKFVERQAPSQQSAVVTPITTPEPQASPSVAVSKTRAYAPPPAEITTPQPQEFVASEPAPPASVQYRCDGRTRCSQMTSCDEAKFFVRNCPGTQMDGDSDGVPCEQQWCGN
jgi:hypothetical protein